MSDKQARIVFVLGSTSDLPQLAGAEALLKDLEVPYEIRILSAHRTPDKVHALASSAKEQGIEAFIAVAGMAAHLAGTLAAITTVPVYGVPAAGGALQGVDALLSTVQMPAGVPVATFGIGKHGCTNAAAFVCRVLAQHDDALAGRVAQSLEGMRAKVLKGDEETRGVRG